MSGINVRLRGGKDMLKRLDKLSEQAATVAIMAVNDTTETLRAQVIRDISRRVKLRQPVIRERIRMTRARRDAPNARIWSVKKGIVLSHYPHRQLWRKGKTKPKVPDGVKVNVGGSWKRLGQAFIVGSAGSDRTDGLIFARTGDSIRALYGPSPSQIMETIKPDYEAKGEELLRSNLERLLSRLQE